MDPQLSMLLSDEMVAVEREINAVRNSGISEDEKRREINTLTIYGRTISFFFEEIPKLVEHIEENKAKRLKK